MFAAKIDWNDIKEESKCSKIELVAEDGTIAGKLVD